MAKRRTKKQKKRAKHTFKISWEPDKKSGKNEPENASSKASVKGQNKKILAGSNSSSVKSGKADSTAKISGLGTIRPDIIKSLILASFILGLELVIYLFW